MLTKEYFDVNEWDMGDRWAWRRFTSTPAIIIHSYDENDLPILDPVSATVTIEAYPAYVADVDVVSVQGYAIEQE